MRRDILPALRLKVVKRANFRCEYCRVPEYFLATIFHVDHIRSIKHGGLTVIENLAFACPHCNQNKGSDVATFTDTEDEETIRLFNPRKDDWNAHFEVQDGEIIPMTKIGEATVRILGFNQPDRLIFRKALTAAGKYP